MSLSQRTAFTPKDKPSKIKRDDFVKWQEGGKWKRGRVVLAKAQRYLVKEIASVEGSIEFADVILQQLTIGTIVNCSVKGATRRCKLLDKTPTGFKVSWEETNSVYKTKKELVRDDSQEESTPVGEKRRRPESVLLSSERKRFKASPLSMGSGIPKGKTTPTSVNLRRPTKKKKLTPTAQSVFATPNSSKCLTPVDLRISRLKDQVAKLEKEKQNLWLEMDRRENIWKAKLKEIKTDVEDNKGDKLKNVEEVYKKKLGEQMEQNAKKIEEIQQNMAKELEQGKLSMSKDMQSQLDQKQTSLNKMKQTYANQFHQAKQNIAKQEKLTQKAKLELSSVQERLSKEISDLKSKLTAASSKSKSLNEKIKKVSDNLAASQMLLKEHEEKAKNIERILEEERGSKSDSEKKLGELKEAQAKLINELKEAKNEVKLSKKECTKHKRLCTTSKKGREKAEKTLDLVKKAKAELEATHQETLKKLEDSKSQILLVQTDLAMAKESLQNEAKLLAAKTSELDSNLEALESTKKLLENEKQLGLKNKTLVQNQTENIENLEELLKKQATKLKSAEAARKKFMLEGELSKEEIQKNRDLYTTLGYQAMIRLEGKPIAA